MPFTMENIILFGKTTDIKCNRVRTCVSFAAIFLNNYYFVQIELERNGTVRIVKGDCEYS